jgi:hypothetical protein
MTAMTEDQIVRLVLKQLGGRSFITINEAVAVVSFALAEQRRLDAASGIDGNGVAQPVPGRVRFRAAA